MCHQRCTTSRRLTAYFNPGKDEFGCSQQCTCGTYSCTLDLLCRTCAGETRQCTACRPGAYRFNGECLDACPATMVAIDSSGPEGGECVPGPTVDCFKSAGCLCPSSLGVCADCRIGVAGIAPECQRCDNNRYLYLKDGLMRCNAELTCRGSKFEEMPESNCNCKTDIAPGNNCFRCKYKGGSMSNPASKSCTQCRNAKYFSQGACVEAGQCPAGEVESYPGNYGRKCQVPFTCRNGRITDGPNAGRPCKCFAACKACQYSTSGHVCTLCRNKALLDDSGQCVGACPVGQANVGSSS